MKTLLSLCVVAALLSSSPSFAIETSARQAFLIDAKTDAVLLNKNGDEQMHPSSMSKLMTLYIIFDNLKSGKIKLDTEFPVSEKAWRMKGSKTFVKLDSKITVEDLVHGISVQSGNDACIVAAEGISGSEEAFAREMNRYANKLGLKNSKFTNATGWPDDDHLMSSRDLAVLSERLVKDFPDYYPFFAMKKFTYNNIKQYNRNRLLGNMDGVDGLKTGHTEVAGYGIVLSAERDGRRLILVVNGLDSDKARVQEGERLLRYGFNEFDNKTIARKGQQVAQADVWMGREKTVSLMVAEDALVTLPIDAAKSASFILKYQAPLVAPIQAGAHVADLVIRFKEGEDQVIPLAAAQDVPKLSAFGRILANIKYRFM